MEADDAYMPYYGTDVLERTMKCKQRFVDSEPAATDIVGAEWFEFRQAEFNLWSRTLSAASQGKSSLDYRLRYHDELRQLVCNLLDGLVEALDDVFKLNRSESPSDRSPENAGSDVESDADMASIHSDEFLSESEDGTESTMDLSPENQSREDSVDIQKFYVTTTIAQLARLSTKIRESGAKYRYLKADAALNERDFEEPTRFWINDILGRRIRPDNSAGFPEITAGSEYLDESMLSTVQKRLVKANLLRLNRIEFVRKRRQIYQATYSVNQQQLLQQQPNMDLKQQDPSTTDPFSTKDQHELQPQQQQQQQQQKDTIAPSVQYTATDVGSTIAAPSFTRLMEPSIVSRATRIGRRGDLEYPKCPKPQTDGASLVCPYCADLLPSEYNKKSTSWRKHVAQDILPYICFYEQCETPDLMYASSEELMKHVNRCHSQLLWVCTQCTTETTGTDSLTFTDLPSWEAHTCQHHNKVPTSAELALLAEACQETIPHLVTCPLCMQSTDASIAGDDDHILWHLHQFALNCLPWDKDDDDLRSVGDMDTIDDQELIDNEALLDEEESVIYIGEITVEEISRTFDPERMYHTHFSDASWSDTGINDGISEPLHRDIESPSTPTVPLPTPSSSELETRSETITMFEEAETPTFTNNDFVPAHPAAATSDSAKGKRLGVYESLSRVGSCLKCRIQKALCSTVSPCNTCQKAYPLVAPETCCIRQDFVTVADNLDCRRFDHLTITGEIAIKNALTKVIPTFQDILFPGRILFDRNFSKSKLGPEAILRNYVCSTDDRNNVNCGCTFSRDHHNPALTLQSLLSWAERSKSAEEYPTFEDAIEAFIETSYKCTSLGTFHSLTQTLVQKAHVFKCMYKIYRCRRMYFLQTSSPEEIQPLPRPAHAELRDVVKSNLESSEREILVALGKLTRPRSFNDSEKGFVWAVCWQLMLVHRELLTDIGRDRDYRMDNKAGHLYNALAVCYAAWFRTSASLQFDAFLDRLPDRLPGKEVELAKAFKFALGLRDTFYQSIVAGVTSFDKHLTVVVVAPEMKVLSRRRPKKAVDGMPSASDGHRDEVMGGP